MPSEQSVSQREYRKTATIRASQWWQMGDHPAVVRDGSAYWIDTLEGGHKVTPGDWIATGVKGEHWPIKPDVFATSYVPVDASTQPANTDDGLAALLREALRRGFKEPNGRDYASGDDFHDALADYDAFIARIDQALSSRGQA